MEERKNFRLSEVKTGAAKGEFEAIVSVFGNVDYVGDRVMPGAFKRAIAESSPPAVVWSHQWQGVPPIGETLDWSESDKGLFIKARLFVDEDDRHSYADMVYAAMKSRDGRIPALREFSFAYDVGASDSVTEDGAEIRQLKEIFPVHEVGPTLRGANPDTELLSAVKQLQEWTPVTRSALTDMEQLGTIVHDHLTTSSAAKSEPPEDEIDARRLLKLLEWGVTIPRPLRR